MSKISLIKDMIEKNKGKIVRRTVAVVLSLGVLAGALTGCGNNNKNDTKDIKESVKATEDTQYTKTDNDTQSDDKQIDNTDSQINSTDKQTESTNNPTESGTDNVKPKFVHSDTYNRAKQKWASMWNMRTEDIYFGGQNEFVTKAAPYTFLAEQGVVYFDSQGKPHAYGSEDYSHYNAVQSKVLIDSNSPENDIHIVVQYRDGEIPKTGTGNAAAVVATWGLRYEVPDDVYQEVLAMKNDYRLGFLIQQIDIEYNPEVLHHSLVRNRVLKNYNLFSNLSNGTNQWGMDAMNPDIVNYIADVDYDNWNIVVHYSEETGKDKVKIHEYNFAMKECDGWDDALEGDFILKPMDKEHRDNLSVDSVMHNSQTQLGKTLDDCDVDRTFMLLPTDAQKAAAEVVYEFDMLNLICTQQSTQFNKFENGEIAFEYINDLTRNYVNQNSLIK